MSDKHYTHPDQTYLESALRSLRPWLEANATFLIYGLAAVLAAVAGIVWYQRQPEENVALSALWMDAREPEDYQNIADTWEGTRLGTLARLSQADSLLNNASRSRFTDRQAALTDQELAEAALNRLAERTDLDGASRQRILMDQARLAELNCDGSEESVKKAVAAWQAVLEEFETPWAKDYIEDRIERLQKPEAGRFYAWFSQLDPKPIDNLDPPQDGQDAPSGDGPTSVVPDIPELPEMGDGSAGTSSETPSGSENGSLDPDASGEASDDSPTSESSDSPENRTGNGDDASEESAEDSSSSENSDESSTGTSDPPVEEGSESGSSGDSSDADSLSADEGPNDSSANEPDSDTKE